MKFSTLPNEAKIEFINQVAAKSNRKLPEQIIEKRLVGDTSPQSGVLFAIR